MKKIWCVDLKRCLLCLSEAYSFSCTRTLSGAFLGMLLQFYCVEVIKCFELLQAKVQSLNPMILIQLRISYNDSMIFCKATGLRSG